MPETTVLESTGNCLSLLDKPTEIYRNYRLSSQVKIPDYLQETYWWAYLHPRGVRFFERQWLVNLILWGNYVRLRDAALEETGTTFSGRMLQVACVYGDFTTRLAARLTATGQLDVMDVAPVQLENLTRKIGDTANVFIHHLDSNHLSFADATYDSVVVFFLLHEQPTAARIKTLHEAIRVVKPGGKVIVVDYHRPHPLSPLRYLMMPILSILEPFALDVWRHAIQDWLPADLPVSQIAKQTYFGGLYQKVVITR